LKGASTFRGIFCSALTRSQPFILLQVVDVDKDHKFEIFINAQHEQNRVLKWRSGALVDVSLALGLDDSAPDRTTKVKAPNNCTTHQTHNSGGQD
jgi:hypothetical protein